MLSGFFEEHNYGLKNRLWASFLTLNKLLIKFFRFSTISNYLGIRSHPAISSMESTVVQKDENKVKIKTLAVYHHQVRELSILTAIIIQSFPLHFVLWLKKTLYQIKY